MSETADREAVLAPLRQRIDAVDAKLVALLAERMRCVDEVMALKQAHALPARLDDRVEKVVAHVRSVAEDVGAPPELAEVVWRALIEWIIAYEDRCLGDPAREPMRLP